MPLLSDTYVAALQHDLAELPPETTRVGVVRRPMPWVSAAVDENVPELGPPAELLDSFRQVEEDRKMQGLCAEGAHNAAWEQIGFGDRYRDYLDSSPAARSALDTLTSRLESGESFEYASRKRCWRSACGSGDWP